MSHNESNKNESSYGYLLEKLLSRRLRKQPQKKNKKNRQKRNSTRKKEAPILSICKPFLTTIYGVGGGGGGNYNS